MMVAGIRAGDPSCINSFLDLAAGTIWPTVVALVGEGRSADEAFPPIIQALSENRFQRLSGYDGRSSLATYLVVVTRDLLAREVQRLLFVDRNRAWRRFDRMFAKDVRRLIRKHFPRAGVDRQDDLFQEVNARLVENDYHRIRFYRGKGSFVGYVLTVVDKLLYDMVREEAGRPRLPAQIERMSQLHQALYIAGAYGRVPIDPDRMAEAISSKIKPPPDRVELTAALESVTPAIIQARAKIRPREVPLDGGEDDSPGTQIASGDLTPEEMVIRQQEEEADQAVIELVRRQAELLPADMQLYLKITLQACDPLKAQEIARQMAVSVDEIYKLAQKQKAWAAQIGAELKKMAAGPSDSGRSMKPA